MRNRKSFVIVNADDFGITKGVNRAIIDLVEAGVVTSTTVMANMPYYEEILKLTDKIGIGVHFNLTTGRPLCDAGEVSSLIGKDGEFPELPALLQLVKRNQISEKEVFMELEAQIKRLLNIGVMIDHMDSHESLLKYPFFMKVMKALAQKHNIPAVRTYSPRKFDYCRLLSPKKILISLYLAYQKILWKYSGLKVTDKYDSLLKNGLNRETGIAKLIDIFQNLPSGVLEVAVHPGYCSDDNSPLGGYAYERETEIEALLSDEFRKVLQYSDAELGNYHDI